MRKLFHHKDRSFHQKSSHVMGPRIQIKHGGHTAEEKKLEAKYDLLRKKKALKLAKKMVKDAEKRAKTEKTIKKNEHRDHDVNSDEKGEESLNGKKKTLNGEGEEEDVKEGGEEKKKTTKAMKRPGQQQQQQQQQMILKTTMKEGDDGTTTADDEKNEEKAVGAKRTIQTTTTTTSRNNGEDEDDSRKTIKEEGEKEEALMTRKDATTTTEGEQQKWKDEGKAKESTGAMKITFKKKAPADASKEDASASAASKKKKKKEEEAKKEEEEDPVAKAIAKAKLVMQKENERREKEEKEAELKKKMKEEEEARRKEEEERANAVPKIIVPKFGKKRELDPEWLEQENERYEREQKEREERERIEKEEALKPKKRQQKRPKLAPKKLLPPVPKIVPGVGNLEEGNLDTEAGEMAGSEGATVNGDVEAGEMAVLDDETAKAVGVGQKIHEEVDDHEDDDHRGDSCTEVFVGGIPPEANERDVGDAFSRFGKVSKVRLFDMQSYGFVKFYGVESAAAAVKHYEGCDGTGNNPIEDPVLICDAPVSIVEFAASGKDLVIQKAKEIATKKREGESVEEDEAAKAKAREVMTYEAI